MTHARLFSRAARALVGSLVVVTLVACGNGGGGGNQAAPAKPAGTAQPAAAPATGVGTTVNVVAREMALAFDTTAIRAGTITFSLRNDGHAPHDLAIRGNGIDQKTRIIERGQTATLTVTLTPGTYSYECTVPGHAMAGMRGSFTVTG
jgi:uncharacterized cupredoxin-like copper-binding protein